MEIKNYSAYNEKEILKLYSSVGWTAYTDDPQALKQGFQNSLLVLAAYEACYRRTAWNYSSRWRWGYDRLYSGSSGIS